MSRPLTALAVVLGVATAVVVAAILASSGGGHAATAQRSSGSRDVTGVLRGIPQHGLVLGRPDAPVLLVEFADPQCPFCKEFADGPWPEIVRRYVRAGKVRMELRLMTFLGPDSERGARALLAAGQQDRLWDAAARFYAVQGEENTGYATDAFLRRVLGGVDGLDVRRAMRARASATVDGELGAVHSLASRYGVTSTPTLLIGTSDANLHSIGSGTPSVPQVSASIDAELRKHRP
ncbi:MAG TPA: DsbA family protein [Baekduia sp.]|nr:DsbA family protein [Baekduia sp.]